MSAELKENVSSQKKGAGDVQNCAADLHTPQLPRSIEKRQEIVVEWQGGLKFEGKNQSGGQVFIGGKDDAGRVSPMELLLLGLAGCTGIDVASILEKKRQPVQDFQVVVRAKRADSYPRVYTEIEVEYILWGKGLSPKSVEQAIQLSESKYCSASIMLGKTAKIRSSYRILDPRHEA